jgi:hypothetical protein
VKISTARRDRDKASFKVMVLFEQGFGDAVTIAGNQLLPPDFFCQREGFAGKGLGFRPLLAVEGECCQVACVNGNAFMVIC